MDWSSLLSGLEIKIKIENKYYVYYIICTNKTNKELKKIKIQKESLLLSHFLNLTIIEKEISSQNRYNLVPMI